jgi:tetratricopeptide (TPR) repeat protein
MVKSGLALWKSSAAPMPCTAAKAAHPRRGPAGAAAQVLSRHGSRNFASDSCVTQQTTLDRDQCQGLPSAPLVSAMKRARVVKALNVMAILLAGFSLAATQGAFAQSLDEANALHQQVTRLYNQAHYSEAIPLAERALAIREETLGPDHPDVAKSLDRLADLYEGEGRYADAEPLYKRSLAIRENVLGPDHRAVADSLNKLSILYIDESRLADAEPLYKRSLAILQKALGPDHRDVGTVLTNLAALYTNLGRHQDAESLYKRSLANSNEPRRFPPPWSVEET